MIYSKDVMLYAMQSLFDSLLFGVLMAYTALSVKVALMISKLSK